MSSENRALIGGSGAAMVDLVCKYRRGAYEAAGGAMRCAWPRYGEVAEHGNRQRAIRSTRRLYGHR